ncbi:PH domain-containing protein [Ekhidna sp.]|uniref:PH domain-containing protein n=1 Tax=Ekhidna sp. TaxID=2608089 RepID=UPI0035147605
MKRYYSEVSRFTKWTFLISIAIAWISIIPILIGEISTLFFIVAGLVGLFTVLMSSIYFGTYYQIQDEHIIWVTGPFKGKLAIKDITKVKRAKSIWEIDSTIKPILSQSPLLLRYTRFDDFPVSPEEEDEFVNELLIINPKIEMEPEIISASGLREAPGLS